MIDIQQITVQFGKRKILDDISIRFKQGEIIGLVAPNGTGKSTLMNVMMNYVKPTKGRIVFKDELSYSSKSKEVKIHQFVSLMPDQSDLYDHLSGRAHLKMYAMMWKTDLKKIDDVIEALQMGSYVNKKTRTYSLGMRQRLCFAMQIVADTEIMLMDEVMNGLDPYNIDIISNILMQKKTEGKLIIIASHLLDNLEQYANRIFLFNEGKLIEANDIVKQFSSDEIKAVRVKNMSISIRDEMIVDYPMLQFDTLINGYTIIHLPSSDSQMLGELTQYLIGKELHQFSFGKVTLNDLYAMNYHEVV